MDEFVARAALERGAKAERLLNDPLIAEAFSLVETHIVGKFKDAPIRDEEGVIKAKYLLHALSLVRRVFEDAVRDGKVAERALEDKRRGIHFLGDIWPSRKPRR